MQEQADIAAMNFELHQSYIRSSASDVGSVQSNVRILFVSSYHCISVLYDWLIKFFSFLKQTIV